MTGHVDAEAVFTEAYGLHRRPGMAQGPAVAGPPLQGRHHCGEDGAWNGEVDGWNGEDGARSIAALGVRTAGQRAGQQAWPEEHPLAHVSRPRPRA